MKLTEPPLATTSTRIAPNAARVVGNDSSRVIAISATTPKFARIRTGAAPAEDRLDRPRSDRLLDPWDDLVEHLIERGRGLEAEHAPRLLNGRNPPLDVVFERWVADVSERQAVALDPVPDLLGPGQGGGRLAGGKIEVVVERGGALHRRDDPFGEITRIRVMADLRPTSEDMQRVLPLDDLLHEVGNDVTHRQLDVAAENLHIAER